MEYLNKVLKIFKRTQRYSFLIKQERPVRGYTTPVCDFSPKQSLVCHIIIPSLQKGDVPYNSCALSWTLRSICRGVLARVRRASSAEVPRRGRHPILSHDCICLGCGTPIPEVRTGSPHTQIWWNRDKFSRTKVSEIFKVNTKFVISVQMGLFSLCFINALRVLSEWIYKIVFHQNTIFCS